MTTTSIVHRRIVENGVFVALATVLVSLIGIPVFESFGFGLVGFAAGAVLAGACILVLADRLRHPIAT